MLTLQNFRLFFRDIYRSEFEKKPLSTFIFLLLFFIWGGPRAPKVILFLAFGTQPPCFNVRFLHQCASSSLGLSLQTTLMKILGSVGAFSALFRGEGAAEKADQQHWSFSSLLTSGLCCKCSRPKDLSHFRRGRTSKKANFSVCGQKTNIMLSTLK